MATKPIIVGTDGSEQAMAAVEWAAEEAGRRKAPLRIVSIQAIVLGRRGGGVPVLKLIIATRGSMPKARADAALWMATSARSLALGCGLIAQSPQTTTSSGRHMKNT